MENNVVYLAKIQSLRKSLTERALTSFPVFKNNQNLDDFLGKNVLKQKKYGNEAIINFRDFDEQIKPNTVVKAGGIEKSEKSFLKLYSTNGKKNAKDYEVKSRLASSLKIDDNSSDEFSCDSKNSQNKIDSILTTIKVAKKPNGNFNSNSPNSQSELISDSSNLVFSKLRSEKSSLNKLNKSFSSSIDGKKIDDRNQNVPPLIVEPTQPGRASESSISNSETNQTNSARQQPVASQQNNYNLNFSLPKMNTQFPIRTTSPSLLANVNDIINRSSKISTVHSVKKIRKLLSLDDFNINTELLKPKKLPKGHKLKSALSKKLEQNRIQSSILHPSHPGVNFSKMPISTKSNKPNLMPIEKSNTSIENFKPKDDDTVKTTKQENNHKHYAEKKSYTEFTFKVYITDRSVVPPTTPATELKNENCLLCASLAGSLYNEKSDYLSNTQVNNFQKEYQKYVVSFN